MVEGRIAPCPIIGRVIAIRTRLNCVRISTQSSIRRTSNRKFQRRVMPSFAGKRNLRFTRRLERTSARTRNLRLIGSDPSNFRACENYTDVARVRPTNLLSSPSLSLFLSLRLSLPTTSPSLFSLSHSLSLPPYRGSDAQNRAAGTGWLVPRCRYHEERMSIARSHSFRERETASADFTAFSRYCVEKRTTVLLLDRRSPDRNMRSRSYPRKSIAPRIQLAG